MITYPFINRILHKNIMTQENNFQADSKPEELQIQPLKLSPKKRYKSLFKLMLIITNICLSSFYFGYTIIYLSVIDFKVIMKIYGIEMGKGDAEGLLTFCVPLGGCLGALASSYFIKKVSRRKSILFINYVAFSLGCLVFFVDFKLYMIVRVGQGICAGIYSALVPLIVKQMTPSELSGIFGVFHQLFITIGIFIGCFLAFILSVVYKDETGESFWVVVFAAPLATIALQTVCLNTFFRLETPIYLVNQNDENGARTLLQRIYCSEYVDQIFNGLKAQMNKNTRFSDSGADSQVKIRQNQLKITKKVAIHLALLQQFVGISAVATYARAIAEGSLSSFKTILPSILNFQQVAASIISSFLLSKFGRKTILQFGTLGCAIANLVIFLGFFIQNSHPSLSVGLILTALFYYMANFSLSLGPIVWMYIPEIVRPQFLPYSTMANWGGSALSILLFPMIKVRLPNQNPGPLFLFFAIWSGLSFIVNRRYVIETRNKTPAQIQEQYRQLDDKQ